jgi:ribonucleoside-diphosphate reductase beta chain
VTATNHDQQMDATEQIAADILRPSRTAASWVSPRGINTDLVPWRLWEKSKKLFWDPADIDYSIDREQWAAMPAEYQDAVMATATGFMVGEESVTLDILPLVMAMADEGRLEEVIFLTSFALEEAKHVDFFRRWLSEVGADLDGFRARQKADAERLGVPWDDERRDGMWESELPRVMRHLLVDRSPRAVLDASLTYNQFVEGCLAISGYGIWADLFGALEALPAMQEGIRHVRVDESRHITYGTYLCQRVLSANPELIDFARDRMIELRDFWFTVYPAVEDPDNPIGTEQGRHFKALVFDQVSRRTAVMERAAQMSEDEFLTTSAAEDAERDLLNVTG